MAIEDIVLLKSEPLTLDLILVIIIMLAFVIVLVLTILRLLALPPFSKFQK
ncbi:MAG: hypothetical protein ACPK85_00150 [Methanosarcina sp.]